MFRNTAIRAMARQKMRDLLTECDNITVLLTVLSQEAFRPMAEVRLMVLCPVLSQEQMLTVLDAAAESGADSLVVSCLERLLGNEGTPTPIPPLIIAKLQSLRNRRVRELLRRFA